MKKTRLILTVCTVLLLMLSAFFTSCDKADDNVGNNAGTNVGDNTANNGSQNSAPSTCAHNWKAATCTQAKTCGLCSMTEGSPLGHQLSDWVVTKNATCVTEGSRQQTCLVCSEIVNSEILPAGHTIMVLDAVPASCEAEGRTQGACCTLCGMILAEQKPTAALGHTWVVDAPVAATCTTTGLSEGSHCSRCLFVQKEQAIVPTHTPAPVVDAGIAPSCTHPGLTEGTHCGTCNQVLLAQETLEATGHSFNLYSNTCYNCSSKEYPEIQSRNELLDHKRYAQAVIYLDKCIDDSRKEENFPLTIYPEQTYLRFVGTPGVTYNVTIVVSDNRTQNLTIDFVNATLKSIIDQPVMDIVGSQTTVNVGFFGTNCGFIGKTGDAGSKGDFGKNGSKGKDGSAAIRSNGNVNIVVSADSIELKGGDGGKGGKGGAGLNTGLSVIDAGTGGTGGSGAYAISANAIDIRAAEGYSTSNLILRGGNGGEGGSGGTNKLGKNGPTGNPGADSLASNISPTYH